MKGDNKGFYLMYFVVIIGLLNVTTHGDRSVMSTAIISKLLHAIVIETVLSRLCMTPRARIPHCA